jgi:hypothetical protein
LKFTKGSRIKDMTLHMRISESALFETWVVYKQEELLKKVHLVHFFKFTSLEKSEAEYTLSKFCDYITGYNKRIDNEVESIQLLKCVGDKVQTGFFNEFLIYYYLFEKPVDSFLFSKICNPNCAKERLCKYKIKDFIKGFIKSNLMTSEDIMDVKLVLNSKTIYYGKLDNNDKDNKRSFVALPYPKLKTIHQLKPSYKKTDEDAFKFDEFQAEFGRFLMYMYAGFDLKDDNSESEISELNPYIDEFNDSVQIFEKFNPQIDKLAADAYFGISAYFIKSFKDKDIFKTKDSIKNSFYDFLFKLLKKKFKKMEEILTEKFIVTETPLSRLRSDTIVKAKKNEEE